MGLDVSVYKNVKTTNSEEDYDFVAFVIDEDWKYKIKNLENRARYKGEMCDASISYAYGSHNRFREHLVRMMGRDDLLSNRGEIKWDQLCEEKELPFYDFINFADNEGCLDWETNKKLYGAFVEWKNKAIKYAESELYFDGNYKNWLNIFKSGKEKGVVVFH